MINLVSGQKKLSNTYIRTCGVDYFETLFRHDSGFETRFVRRVPD